MNFAYRGTGVFGTSEKDPNMMDHIDLHEEQIEDELFSPADLNSSLALVILSGNDYSHFEETNSDTLVRSILNQLPLNFHENS